MENSIEYNYAVKRNAFPKGNLLSCYDLFKLEAVDLFQLVF